MKIAFLALAIGASILRADADEFARSSAFESVEAFVTAASTFQPAASKSDLAALFIVRETGVTTDPKTGTPISATSVKSSVALCSNDSYALVFVTAAPPTEATISDVGVLFLLNRIKGSWRIADSLRFTASGKYAAVSAELTADAGNGLTLNRPIVTVHESQGGRPYSYQLSASFTIEASKLKRLELE